MATETTGSYREMRVRPIRDGAEGVTISGTEYVMDISEMIKLRDMLNEGIKRMNGDWEISHA